VKNAKKKTKHCNIHGKKFIQYKCRFCCNAATLFCKGQIHFCEKCHDNAKGMFILLKEGKIPSCYGEGCDG